VCQRVLGTRELCLLYTRRHLHVSLSIRTNEPSLGIFQKSNSVRKSGTIRCKVTITFSGLQNANSRSFLCCAVCIFCKPIHSLTYEITSPIARWEMFILNTCNSLCVLYTIHFSYISKSMVLTVIQRSIPENQQINFDWIKHFSDIVNIIQYKNQLFFYY